MAEIQIRTVIQHAWSAVSHALQYKQEARVPSRLQRRLHRIAGLFELADEEFVAIRKDRETLKEVVRDELHHKFARVVISSTSLNEFIDSWDNFSQLRDTATEAGFSFAEESHGDHTSLLYDLTVLSSLGNIGELEAAILSVPSDYLKNVFENKGESAMWFINDVFLVVLLLIYVAGDRLTEDFLTSRGFGLSVAKEVMSAVKMTRGQQIGAKRKAPRRRSQDGSA